MSGLQHLVVVAGHAVTMQESLEGVERDDRVWYLLPYQRGQVRTPNVRRAKMCVCLLVHLLSFSIPRCPPTSTSHLYLLARHTTPHHTTPQHTPHTDRTCRRRWWRTSARAWRWRPRIPRPSSSSPVSTYVRACVRACVLAHTPKRACPVPRLLSPTDHPSIPAPHPPPHPIPSHRTPQTTGGQTRADAGPKSEGVSYFHVAEHFNVRPVTSLPC